MFENLKKELLSYGIVGRIIFICILLAIYYIVNKYLLRNEVNITTDIYNFIGYSTFGMAMQFSPLFVL